MSSLYRIYNQTTLPDLSFPSLSREDHNLAVVTLTARYRLPAPGRVYEGRLELAAEQHPAPLADVWSGEPGHSSLRWEGQAVYCRPGTDIHVHGHACPPGGRPAKAVCVGVRVGRCQVRLRAVGERRWIRATGELHATPALPFDRMPLCWERAYGGTTPGGKIVAQNPVGVGLYDSAKAATDAALPNLLPLDEDLRSWRSAIRPVGLGPIARHWQPRVRYAGTYDQAWQDHRAPLWPADMDLRLFSAAAPGLRAESPLRGGEEVILEGMHPDGAWAFRLPTHDFILLEGASRHRALALDVVDIDTEARALTMVWRGAAPLERLGVTELRVRDALPWEAHAGEALQ
ncbi:DUF2169 domain-containing protein [Pseudenhygromyxa sp. WMMC2535]|uniref:DUF2169 family type VI secretion system accessory protein n=1 Tax=Pseudenhygromyxa sp. WMMC2535 TaxID=2712867 RepID=UPI001554AE5B|nr:DUF2169 domain-containing protein [Pseudenhygromyxa sp. WMMC2535]NVB41770.1 DUF2169 domain-containing protein [Pseudenhygromyxa sp. WMMC2535]